MGERFAVQRSNEGDDGAAGACLVEVQLRDQANAHRGGGRRVRGSVFLRPDRRSAGLFPRLDSEAVAAERCRCLFTGVILLWERSDLERTNSPRRVDFPIADDRGWVWTCWVPFLAVELDRPTWAAVPQIAGFGLHRPQAINGLARERSDQPAHQLAVVVAALPQLGRWYAGQPDKCTQSRRGSAARPRRGSTPPSRFDATHRVGRKVEGPREGEGVGPRRPPRRPANNCQRRPYGRAETPSFASLGADFQR